jgi:hypothetical protein
MRTALYFTVAVIFCLSCQSNTDNSQTVAGQYLVKKILLKGADSLGIQPMAAMVDAAFHYTNCGSAGVNGKTESPYWEQLAKSDSNFNIFYTSLSGVSREHSCLVTGKCELVDATNPHVLVYTTKEKEQELLVILNFDEDNRAVQAEYRFMDMPLLLSNYDNGAMPVLTSSLMLRPYEVRIYQVN